MVETRHGGQNEQEDSPRRKPEEKAALLKRHLVEKVPVSQICDEEDTQPSIFYGWLHQLMERAPAAFVATPGTTTLMSR